VDSGARVDRHDHMELIRILSVDEPALWVMTSFWSSPGKLGSTVPGWRRRKSPRGDQWMWGGGAYGPIAGEEE